MIDLVKLLLKAGDGGHGRISFRREKYVPRGGPDGGKGGKGGSIIIRATDSRTTLQHLSGVKQIESEPGQPGGKRKKIGKDSSDVVVEVPVGTKVWLLAENTASFKRRQRTELEYALPRGEVNFEKYFVAQEGEWIPEREPDDVRWLNPTDEVVEQRELAEHFKKLEKEDLIELTKDGQEVLIVQGGFGGRGNEFFKASDKTTPLEAEYGTFGEQKVVVLELRLLADVGLVGYPNAGKSTLLSVLTEARPKVGAYPFTTLEPHLGIMHLDEGNRGTDIVIADIPGLIEGASQGKGLGHLFLRHVEHCRTLVFLVYLDESLVFNNEISPEAKAESVWEQYQQLDRELAEYSPDLLVKPRLIALSKTDLYTDELIAAVKQKFATEGVSKLILLSAPIQAGIAQLQQALKQQLQLGE